MAEQKRDPNIVALEAVFAALKDLDKDARARVLSSVSNLLDVSVPAPQAARAAAPVATPVVAASLGGVRPVSPGELIKEKDPGTNAQRIALFAYYREKYEGLQRFSRDDLEGYFAKAKEQPCTNYGRDFVEAVKKGWIHEDGADSYLTTKGVEAVESGFEGERRYQKGANRSKKKSKSRKSKA